MPEPFRFTPRAYDDLGAILDYIAHDNLDAAIRVESAVIKACRLLARNPLIGSKHAELTRLSLRFWPISRFPNYIIVYDPKTKPLQVIAVLHGMRDIKRILRARETP